MLFLHKIHHYYYYYYNTVLALLVLSYHAKIIGATTNSRTTLLLKPHQQRHAHHMALQQQQTRLNTTTMTTSSQQRWIQSSSDVSSNETAPTTTTRGLTDLIDLVPFNIQIGLQSSASNATIQIFEVSNIVTDWMNVGYRIQLGKYGYTAVNNYAAFEALVLLKRTDNRYLRNSRHYGTNLLLQLPSPEVVAHENMKKNDGTRLLQSSNSESKDNSGLYVAQFKGGAYFVQQDRNTLSVPVDDVLTMQQIIFQNTTDLLLRLQDSTALGLGSEVTTVDAVLVPSSSTPTPSLPNDGTPTNDNNNNSNGPSNNTNNDATGMSHTNELEIVIIAAIAVAVLAFLFLLAAIYWAYRFDKRNRDAYLVEAAMAAERKLHKDKTQSDDTASPKSSSPPIKTIYQQRYPTEIVGGSVIGNQVCAESVISDSVVSNDHYRTVRDDDMISEDNEGGDMMAGQAQTTDYDEVSASLSQYYNSGMGKVALPTNVLDKSGQHQQSQQQHRFLMSDAASVSSLESYGFSLDGTAPNSVMSPANGNTGSKTASSGSYNNIQQNPYTRHLERIGGLPVEPDLRHIDQLTIHDIVGYGNGTSSVVDHESTSSASGGGKNHQEQKPSSYHIKSPQQLEMLSQQRQYIPPVASSNHTTNEELPDDLCTIDGSIKFLG